MPVNIWFLKYCGKVLIITFLPVFVPLEAQLRTGSSIALQVTARVTSDSPVEISTLSDMAITGEPEANGEIYISPVTNPNAGLMLAKGRQGSSARMTYIMYEELNEQEGRGSITIHYEMSGYPERVQEASEPILTGETLFKFGPDGRYYLWVGGRVNVANASPGKYAGQFTIEIEYI